MSFYRKQTAKRNLNQTKEKQMKIENMNDWLPKAYFSAWINGKCLGNYSTESEAKAAYESAKASN